MRGLAISFLTLARVELPGFSWLPYAAFAHHNSEMEGILVPFCTVAKNVALRRVPSK
jgi:hypothetical protein